MREVIRTKIDLDLVILLALLRTGIMSIDILYVSCILSNTLFKSVEQLRYYSPLVS